MTFLSSRVIGRLAASLDGMVVLPIVIGFFPC